MKVRNDKFLRSSLYQMAGACIVPALLFLLWFCWVAANQFNQIVMPTPLAVITDFAYNPTLYCRELSLTLVTAVLGMGVGIVLASVLALVGWLSALFQSLVTPVSLISSTVPIAAIIPLLARIFGYGSTTTIAIVAILCFFQTFVLVSRGLRAVPPGSADLATCFGAKPITVLRTIAVPTAVPYLLVAIRTTAGQAVGAALIAEYLMGIRGTGALIRLATDQFMTDRAIGLSIGATWVAVILYTLATGIERNFAPRWR